MNGTEQMFNLTTNIVDGVPGGLPLVMAVIIVALWMRTGNTFTVILVGGMFALISYTLDIDNWEFGVFILIGFAMVTIITNMLSGDEPFSQRRRRRRHSGILDDIDILPHDATFIKKIMVVLGLAHKKEIKKNDKT